MMKYKSTMLNQAFDGLPILPLLRSRLLDWVKEAEEPKKDKGLEQQINQLSDKTHRDITLQEFWSGHTELAKKMLSANSLQEALKLRNEHRQQFRTGLKNATC